MSHLGSLRRGRHSKRKRKGLTPRNQRIEEIFDWGCRARAPDGASKSVPSRDQPIFEFLNVRGQRSDSSVWEPWGRPWLLTLIKKGFLSGCMTLVQVRAENSYPEQRN